MTAPEIPDLARQHGAPWATQATQDELMKMEQHDYSTGPWKHRPHPQKRGPEGGTVIVLAVAVIAALAFSAIYTVRFL